MLTKDQYLEEMDSYGGACKDCRGKNQGYMVQFEIWRQLTSPEERRRFLCVKCLEKRLGRRLIKSDFLDAPINFGVGGFNVDAYIKLP